MALLSFRDDKSKNVEAGHLTEKIVSSVVLWIRQNEFMHIIQILSVRYISDSGHFKKNYIVMCMCRACACDFVSEEAGSISWS